MIEINNKRETAHSKVDQTCSKSEQVLCTSSSRIGAFRAAICKSIRYDG